MNITEATIHELKKAAQTSGEGSVVINPRSTPLSRDQLLTDLSAELLAMYAKAIDSNGTLGEDPTLHTFPVRLREYVDAGISFQDFSTATSRLIADEMKDSLFSSGGYALFLRYTQGAEDFLLVAMLKLKPGAGIDARTLSLEKTLSIDPGLLHEAARVNLSRWRSEVQPYLTFIKGRAKQGNVTEYFRSALACLNFTTSSHHTSEVIKASRDFVESLPLSEVEKRDRHVQVRKKLYECFVDNPDEVAFPTIAAAVAPNEPQDFIDFVRTGPLASSYTINEKFKPDQGTYKRIKRISGKIGRSVSVAFDVSDVHARNVYYDAEIDALVLKSPPDHIKQAVKENAPQ